MMMVAQPPLVEITGKLFIAVLLCNKTITYIYIYCIVLYCTVPYCTVLYCTVLYCQQSKPTTGISHATK